MEAGETQEVKLWTTDLCCLQHAHGWIFFPSIPRVCLHFSLSTHTGSKYHYAAHRYAASEIGPWPNEIQWVQRDETNSPLSGSVEPGQNLQAALLSSRGGNPAFLPCLTGEVSGRINSCWGSPKGAASPACGEFCSFSLCIFNQS